LSKWRPEGRPLKIKDAATKQPKTKHLLKK